MDTLPVPVIKDNLQTITRNIQAACRRSGRHESELKIMAVTKTFSSAYIEAAVECGISLFGENRVQEAAGKYTPLLSTGAFKQTGIELHLIGHLQRNKAKKAGELFSCVQSIDKFETASALDTAVKQIGRTMDVLLEVNTSQEETKSGVRDQDQYWELLDVILEKCANLKFRGLMTIGPFTGDTGAVRASFSSLRELFLKTKSRYPGISADILSMGMSGDYEIAAEEGSTMVRIGTALFGERRYE
jgi:pyridoxal phosphate enzyme (YggS family)